MPELLKDRYNLDFFTQFCEVGEEVIPDFEKDMFLKKIFSDDWEMLELKDRMRHSAITLHDFMPDDFEFAAKLLIENVTVLQDRQLNHLGLEYMFIPEYIERYGLDHFKPSMKTIEVVTQFTSCEFAIRPFYIKYPERTLDMMTAWSKHQSKDIRRLSSEGSRPRLPWAMALPHFKKNPQPILPILHQMKNDPSEYVRRSVANNINDISKDNPDVVVALCQKWIGKSAELDKLLKHGSRTLLKSAHPEILKIFGYDGKNFLLKEFKITTPIVKIGSRLNFEATLKNLDNKSKMIRLEFALFYLRNNGTYNKKVFKLSEKEYNANVEVTINKSQIINNISARKYYEGKHYLAMIYNGVETNKLEFYLSE